MNKTSTNIKLNFIIDEPKKKSRNSLIKSSSTTSNNYYIYDNNYSKISLLKNKTRNIEEGMKKSNSSNSKFSLKKKQSKIF